jgi:hypothetical protein
MASSKIDICNAALIKLGQDIRIVTFGEQTKAGRLFAVIWDRILEYVLADAAWPFATKSVALALLDEPALGWQYAYDYPSDCLNAITVCTEDGVRSAARCAFAGNVYPNANEFEVLQGEQSAIIATDLESAYLIYSSRVDDTGKFPPLFVDALSSRLAIEAAPALASEIGLRLAPQLEQKYLAAKFKANAHDMNEGNDQREMYSPTLASRGDGMPIQWPGCCS